MDMMVFGLFTVCVLVGVSMIIIGLSKPGENFLVCFAERACKKYLGITLALAFALAIPAAAWAGDSWVFSKQQEAKIANIVSANFARDIVCIETTHEICYSRVECRTFNSKEYIVFDVYASGAVIIRGLGDMKTAKRAECIRDKIEAMLNPSASEELRRDYLDKK